MCPHFSHTSSPPTHTPSPLTHTLTSHTHTFTSHTHPHFAHTSSPLTHSPHHTPSPLSGTPSSFTVMVSSNVVLSKVQHHTTNSGSYKLMGPPITQSSLEQQYQLTTTTTLTTTATTKNVGKETPSSPVQKLASLDAESRCKPSPVKPRDRALKNVSVADIKKRLMKSLTTEEDEPKQITPHRGCVKNTGSATVTTVYEPTGEVTKSNRELSDSPGRRAGSNKKDKVKDGSNSELTVEGNQGEGNLVGRPLKTDIAPPSPPLFKSRGSSPLTCSEKSLTPPLATGEHIYRKSPDTSLRISNLFSGTRRPATSKKVKALSMKFDKAN